MSDLQCAARVFVAAYADEATSRQLASLLSGERIARVWATAGEQAVEPAHDARAARLARKAAKALPAVPARTEAVMTVRRSI